jgi:hypothetical protein
MLEGTRGNWRFFEPSGIARHRILNLEFPERAVKTREITMNQAGPFTPALRAENFGLKDLKSISFNLQAARLIEHAIRRGAAMSRKAAPFPPRSESIPQTSGIRKEIAVRPLRTALELTRAR